MSIKRIDVGSRLSGAVIHGNTVYLAGQVGEGDSVTDQCKSSLADVDRLLAASGSSKS
ncbi:RidA family protein, partial [Rhizobium ruizarguesonis]